MYKVKNITNGKLFINDLNLKLSCGEVVDLDTKMSREAIENSAHLKIAEAKELLAVLHKDVISVPPQTIDPVALLEVENRIRQQMLTEIANIRPQPQPVAPQTDLSGLSSKIDDLINAVKQQPQAVAAESTEQPLNADNQDKLVEVHAKAMKRIVGDSTGRVEAKEEVVNSDIAERASELDDFLQ